MESDFGEVAYTVVLEGCCNSSPAWSPDGRQIIASINGLGLVDSRLVLVDAETGQSTDLGICGVEPSFSPDGSKIVYVSYAIDGPNLGESSVIHASIFVRNLRGSPSAVRLTTDAPGEGAAVPHWSPDGTRVLYYQRGKGLRVVRADGSRNVQICTESDLRSDRVLSTVASEPRLGWTRSGDAVYLTTDRGVLLYASDGSGLKANLSEERGGSTLASAEMTQTEQAIAHVKEAVFMYARGLIATFEGRTQESRLAFQSAADLFSELVWRYPLAGFATSDVLRYADKAQRLADLTDEQLLADGCWQHMRYLRGLLSNWGHIERVPLSLADLEQWTLANGSSKETHISWLEGSDVEHVRMAFQCPGAREALPVDYIYTPPQDGVLPTLGTNMVVCPNHPNHVIRWWNCDAWGNGFAPRPMIFPWCAPYSY